MPSPLYITDSFFLIHNQVRLRLQLQPLHLSLSHSSVRFLLGFVRDQAAAEPARDAQAHAQIDAQTVTDSQSSSDAQSASDAQSSCDAQSVWDAQSVADAQPVLWLCAVQPLYLHVDHVARIPLLDETLSSTNMVEVIPLYDRTSLPLPLSSNFPLPTPNPPPSPRWSHSARYASPLAASSSPPRPTPRSSRRLLPTGGRSSSHSCTGASRDWPPSVRYSTWPTDCRRYSWGHCDPRRGGGSGMEAPGSQAQSLSRGSLLLRGCCCSRRCDGLAASGCSIRHNYPD